MDKIEYRNCFSLVGLNLSTSLNEPDMKTAAPIKCDSVRYSVL